MATASCLPGFDPLKHMHPEVPPTSRGCSRTPLPRQKSHSKGSSFVRVTIQGTVESQEFALSQTTLCDSSAFFSTMLDGDFKEARLKHVTLAEEENLLSVASFSKLSQLMDGQRISLNDVPYTVSFEDPWKSDPIQAIEGTQTYAKISLLLEMSCLADFLQCTMVIQEKIAVQIYLVILQARQKHPILAFQQSENKRPPQDHNILYLTDEHIRRAYLLAPGNPTRRAIYTACFRSFVASVDMKETFYFIRLLAEIPEFAVDMALQLIHGTGWRVTSPQVRSYMLDPFDNTMFHREGTGFTQLSPAKPPLPLLKRAAEAESDDSTDEELIRYFEEWIVISKKDVVDTLKRLENPEPTVREPSWGEETDWTETPGLRIGDTCCDEFCVSSGF